MAKLNPRGTAILTFRHPKNHSAAGEIERHLRAAQADPLTQVQHDPLICGLDSATDCPACRRQRRPWRSSAEARKRWAALLSDHDWLTRPADRYGDGALPPLLGIDQLRALIGSLAHPEVAAAVAQLLAPAIRRETEGRP